MNENVILPTLLLVVVVWEVLFPAVKGVLTFSPRRIGNLIFFPLNIGVSAVIKPLLVAFFSYIFFDFDRGLLLPLSAFPLVHATVAFLLLDLSMYAQHRLLHTGRFFWRLHALHHSDSAVDFTTYFRHHPLETVISGVMTFTIATLLGTTLAVFVDYLLVNNAMQLFQHGNVQLPKCFRWIERFFVTPAFHAQHHSIDRGVSDTNFSTVFTVWDRIFGTYRSVENQPKQFGILEFESPYAQSIGTMMAMPGLVYRGSKRFVTPNQFSQERIDPLA